MPVPRHDDPFRLPDDVHVDVQEHVCFTSYDTVTKCSLKKLGKTQGRKREKRNDTSMQANSMG